MQEGERRRTSVALEYQQQTMEISVKLARIADLEAPSFTSTVPPKGGLMGSVQQRPLTGASMLQI